jgi:2-hydroxy-3-oxopropionate reductase
VAVIGFIGPGIMGKPMAANLVCAGHDVRCYGRSAGSQERAVAAGATAAPSVREACAGADIAITMLPDSPDVLDAAAGPDGVLAALKPGSLYIDHSTISPEAARDLHREAEAAGIDALDAPVSGGEAGAVEGTLSIMAGGRQEVFDRAVPVLRCVGTTAVLVGPAGAGQVVKAANQLIVAGNIALLAEATVFLDRHEVDLNAAFDVLAGGLAGSTVLERKRANMVSRSYAPGFRIELHDKDLGILAAAARRRGLSLPVAGLVSSLVAAVKARGGGGLDHSALLDLALALNSVPGAEPSSKEVPA